MFGGLTLQVGCDSLIPVGTESPSEQPAAEAESDSVAQQAASPEEQSIWADAKELEEGVYRVEHEDAEGREYWLYADSRVPSDERPVVLIAPAGSNLMTGIDLGAGDISEHIPYVKAGFYVVAYSLPGAAPQSDSEEEWAAALKRFKSDEGGVKTAERAIGVAASFLPVRDDSILVAGHSSAATHALLVAARLSEVDAVVAFAPVPDVVQFLGSDAVAAMEQAMPGYGSFLKGISPASYVEALSQKPVFLFHAEEDPVAPFAATRALDEAMRSAGRHPRSKLVVANAAESDAHYGPMVEDGIAQAIEWFRNVLPD